MKIFWTERAQADLLDIGRYIGRDNREAVRRLLSRIRKKVHLLVENPFLGRQVPEFTDKHLREIFQGNYRIIYKIKSESIDIITVFEGHKLFKD